MNHVRGLAAVLCVLAAVPAHAQLDTATIVGTVTDSQGAVLPGVSITARNVETGFTRSGPTNAEGRYRIAAVPPGRYEIHAELTGFAPVIRGGVTLTLGSESVINFQMELASVSEAVTVTADTPVVETTTASVAGTLNRDQIDLLPLIGRNYESLLRLAPGAQSSNGFAVAGSRGRSNQWTIDGVDNSEDISGYSRQSPAVDSIKEIQVLTNGFRAEYGSASGGIVNVVTRSGTNDVDGNVFFLFRNQDLMSRSPYANRALPKDPFQRVHYGGTVGGPIRRDKMHFFGTYEREDRDTFTASTVVLPTAAQIAGASAATRQFLQQAGVDISRFGNGGTQRLTRPEYVDVHKATARVDTQLSADTFLTVRYTLDHDTRPSGEGGTILDYNGATSFFRTNYANANHKWIVGFNKLNEAYFQVGQSYGDWWVAYPGLINVNVTGGFSLGGPSNFPQGRTDYVYQLVDNFTWTMPTTRTGEHAVKIGGQMKLFRSNSFFDSNFRGTYTFPSMQRFLDGSPSAFSQNRGDSTLARPNDIYAIYLQDDWRPRPSLTLNLGIRYDYEGAKTEALKDVDGRAGPGISGDKNNVAPRFGFAWAPGGGTRQVFYGGTGKYYDQIILNIVGNARFTPPKVIGVTLNTLPIPFPDPSSGVFGTPTPNISIIDPDLVTPWNWNSQFGYRRELTRNVGLDVSYLHNRGYDHVLIRNINAYAPGTTNINGNPPAGVTRPDPAFGNKSFYTNIGEIRYNGMIAAVRKRLSSRWQGDFIYTLSKSENNSFNFVSGVVVPERPDLDWGPSDDDRRHRFQGNFLFSLPLGLELGTAVEAFTEAPFSVTAARDLNGDGITGDYVNESICRNLPTCGGRTYTRNSTRQLTLEEANALRSLFGLAPIDTVAKNPRYFNSDITLRKRLRFGGHGARISVEAFNLFNVPQRTVITQGSQSQNWSVTSATFANYTAVVQPRAVQFTLQYDF